jgi:hypothetical protein
MKYTRRLGYKKRFYELIEMYGRLCFYCREEISTTIDHVIPVSWFQDDEIENLVPACALCNCLAGNKHFDSVEHKRQYILKRRRSRKLRRSICADCLLPFEYRVMSPSLFLCAECYDLEYGTSHSRRAIWDKWITLLDHAGVYIYAHRRLRENLHHFRADDKKAKVEFLVDGYDEYEMQQDEE